MASVVQLLAEVVVVPGAGLVLGEVAVAVLVQ